DDGDAVHFVGEGERGGDLRVAPRNADARSPDVPEPTVIEWAPVDQKLNRGDGLGARRVSARGNRQAIGLDTKVVSRVEIVDVWRRELGEVREPVVFYLREACAAHFVARADGLLDATTHLNELLNDVIEA